MIWHLLNDYEIEIYKKIESLQFNKWYRIDPLRPDKDELILAVKKRIDLHEDCIFDTYPIPNWFKRCSTIKELEDVWNYKEAK